MSNITITEFRGLAVDRHGARLTYPQLPPLAQQVLVIGSTSQQSNSFAPLTRLVSLYAEAVCRVAIGDAPDALAAGFVLPANVERTFHVAAGARLAVLDGLPLATPLFTTAAVLNANTAGNAATWPAAVAAGSPTPAITYSLRKNGIEVATTSGSYSATSAGDILTLVTTATASTGAKSILTSDAVTVTAAVPSISVAPVLSAVPAGGAINFTAGTFVGTPTYSLMRGATVLAANITSGQVVAGTVAADQVFVRLVVSSSGQTPAQADSNTVAVSVADPQMFATSARLGGFSSSRVVVSGQEYQTLAFVYPPMPYAQKAPRFWFPGFGASLTSPYEPALPNSCLFEGVSVEINGVRTIVKVNGAQAFTLNPDDFIGTDPDDSIVIPANTYFRVIVSTYVPVGQSRPAPAKTNANQVNSASLQDGFRVGSTSQAVFLTTGTITAGSGYEGPAPSFITAKGWKDAGYPSVSLVVGMSITGGADDSSGNSTPSDLVSGAINRGLNDNVSSTRMAFANIAVGGTASTNISAAQSPKRMAAISAMGNPFSMWLYNHGTNDGGGPAAIAGAQACFAYLKSIANKPIKALTIPPKVTFADAKIGATTLANQIVVDNSAYRTFVLGGSASDANLAGGADIWAPIEPTPGAGKFAVPGFTTTLAAAYTAASNSMSLTDSPPLDSSLFIGVGLTNSTVGASAQVVSTVTGTGPYAVTLRSGTTAPATASGSVVAQIPSIDGTHPVRSQHTLALPPIYALKNGGFFV